MVSQRLQQVPASGTLAISNLVSQLKSEGIDVLSFSLGEPDFTTPGNIIEAAKASLDSGFTHYTPSMGIPELRKAVAERARSFNKLDVQAKNVLITPCKHAIFMAAMAYIDPGDEVLLPDPGWVTYEADIRLCGGIPVYVPLKFEDGLTTCECEFCGSLQTVPSIDNEKKELNHKIMKDKINKENKNIQN